MMDLKRLKKIIKSEDFQKDIPDNKIYRLLKKKITKGNLKKVVDRFG
jgi:hypothetical protein